MTTRPEFPQHVALARVAELLDAPEKFLRGLARRGEFPALIRLGRTRFAVRVDQLEEWLRGRTYSKDRIDTTTVYLRSLLKPAERRRQREASSAR